MADEATTDGPPQLQFNRGFAQLEYICGVSSHDRHVQGRSSDLLSPARGSARDTEVVCVADMVSVVCGASLVGAAAAAV